MSSKVCGLFLSVCIALAACGKEPAFWYSIPETFETMRMECKEGQFKRFCNDHKLRRYMEVPGPKFVAYVYYEEEAYDKRVVYTAYVQTMKEGCKDPRDCDGRKGANEFDMVETGFVGFNNTWFINDNKRCLTHWCNAQSTCGAMGCSWAPGSCRVGDYNGCNTQTNSETMPPACTWTDVQNAFSMCTQSAQLDPMQQDFTVVSANGYLHGETGPMPYGCPGTAPCNGGYVWNMDTKSAVSPVNNKRSYAVQTSDGNWGNRWIRLELELDGPTAHYTYRFFKPGKITDTDVTVTTVQSFSLTSTSGKPVFEKDTPHYWVFSIWQYDFEFAVPTTKIKESTRHLHLHVVKDVASDSLKHVAGGQEDKKAVGSEDSSPADDTEEKAELVSVNLRAATVPFANVATGSCVLAFLVTVLFIGSLVIRRNSRHARAVLLADGEYSSTDFVE